MSTAYGCQSVEMTELPIAAWNGRFAPSPTGDLHVGNLRTALVAWLVARQHHASFTIRMEDLDPAVSRREFADNQLRDLAAIGLDWDGEVVFQSDRHENYQLALDRLHADGLVYECYCTRKEIQGASEAPHGPQLEGRYPGTCRDLTDIQRSQRRATGRPPALRLRSMVDVGVVNDVRLGRHSFPVDDFVLRRNDGTWAYNLAVVVDDGEQQIGTVVRADDLLPSTPRQQYLSALLGLSPIQYLHIPLVVNQRSERLAKRDGAVTLQQLAVAGMTSSQLLLRLGESLGIARPVMTVELPGAQPVDWLCRQLTDGFDVHQIPSDPWVWGVD
jgi:glutamyl-tRNA synthetase